VVNRPLRARKSRDEKRVIDLDETLNLVGTVKRCPYCGGKMVKNGKRRLKNGFKIQTYLCRDCGKSFRITTILFMAVKPLKPVCGRCGAIMVMNGRSRGKQRFRCPKCGSTRPAQRSFPSSSSLAKPSNLQVANDVFGVMTDIVLLAALGRENIDKVIKLGLAVRKVKYHLSYQDYKALTVSPKPFSYIKSYDDNTVHRAIETIDHKILDEVIDFTSLLAENLAPRPLVEAKLYAIDSSEVTVELSRLSARRQTLKSHILVDLSTGVVKGVLEKPEITLEEIMSISFLLGDGEYWQIRLMRDSLRRTIIPIAKPRRNNSSDELLKALRWIVNKYKPILYPLRGIVEHFIGFLFPHNNKAGAVKKDNAIKLLKVRAIAYNILKIAIYQDMFLRQHLGISLKAYIDENMPKNTQIPINLYQHMAAQVLKPAKLEVN